MGMRWTLWVWTSFRGRSRSNWRHVRRLVRFYFHFFLNFKSEQPAWCRSWWAFTGTVSPRYCGWNHPLNQQSWSSSTQAGSLLITSILAVLWGWYTTGSGTTRASCLILFFSPPFNSNIFFSRKDIYKSRPSGRELPRGLPKQLYSNWRRSRGSPMLR